MLPFTRLQRLHSPVFAPANLIRSSLLGGGIDVWRHADRVNELQGHTGCVNALSWSVDGQILVSGGDDRTIRLWQLDPNDLDTPLPFKTCFSFHTGHTANIFNAQFLSQSLDILATCAGDEQVRIFDLSRVTSLASSSANPSKTKHSSLPSTDLPCERVISCHRGPVKRISTEETNRHFLTVAEDGTVRQHDLRSSHRCVPSHSQCPKPLVQLPFDLSSLSTSHLTPYYFVVAGMASCGFLYDRRYCDRNLLAEWGIPASAQGSPTCVLRLGRSERDRKRKLSQDHITGTRMSHVNAHEVLLSYSADAIYLYNTQDEPLSLAKRRSVTLSPNSRPKRRRTASGSSTDLRKDVTIDMEDEDEGPGKQNTFPDVDYMGDEIVIDEEGSGSYSEAESDSDTDSASMLPVVLPRRRYAGVCNVETVKDVNFLGRQNEFVASGSDDGNFFVWNKDTGRLLNILEGDESVVNVIEENPRFQCCAVSGIDHTVKIFSPSRLPSKFSRITEEESIRSANAKQTRDMDSQRAQLLELVARFRRVVSDDESDSEEGNGGPECVYQ